MKKRFIAVFLIVCLLASVLSFYSFASAAGISDIQVSFIYQYTFLSNPGGSPVPARRFIAYDPPEYGTAYENQLNEEMTQLIPLAIRLHTATARYNCHSYAWVSQNATTQEYWVDDPGNFYLTGNTYVEVTTPMAGDIICYFDDNGTPNDTSDDTNLHSGIVVVTNVATSNGLCGNSNTVLVESKWGKYGVYRHNGYECPYTDYYLSVKPTVPEKSRAEYVKYFRKSNHTHNFNSYTGDSHMDYHECACYCGRIIHEMHEWISTPIRPRSIVSPDYVPQYTCAKCGVVTLYPNFPII